MARRVKEEPKVHRDRIAGAAERLFLDKGIDKTTVSDIADEAGYSKATLYVYFKSKDDIISYLVLRSMSLLRELIVSKTSRRKSDKTNFLGICRAVLEYRKEYPVYFALLQDNINVDFSDGKCPAEDEEIYETGEAVNSYISELFGLGKDAFVRIFSFWGFLCGIITMAEAKSDYIEKQSGLEPDAFLEKSFSLLYNALFTG